VRKAEVKDRGRQDGSRRKREHGFLPCDGIDQMKNHFLAS